MMIFPYPITIIYGEKKMKSGEKKYVGVTPPPPPPPRSATLGILPSLSKHPGAAPGYPPDSWEGVTGYEVHIWFFISFDPFYKLIFNGRGQWDDGFYMHNINNIGLTFFLSLWLSSFLILHLFLALSLSLLMLSLYVTCIFPKYFV